MNLLKEVPSVMVEYSVGKRVIFASNNGCKRRGRDTGKCKTRENMAIRGVVTNCFRNFARMLSFSLHKGSLGN